MKKLLLFLPVLILLFASCSEDEVPVIKLTKIEVTSFPENDRVGGNLLTWDDYDFTAPNDTLPDIFVNIEDGQGQEVWRTVDYEVNSYFDAQNGDNIVFTLGVAQTLEAEVAYNIQVLDYDAFSSNDLMGSVQMKPADQNINSSETPITLTNGDLTVVLYLSMD
jgi:hypothetical protein